MFTGMVKAHITFAKNFYIYFNLKIRGFVTKLFLTVIKSEGNDSGIFILFFFVTSDKNSCLFLYFGTNILTFKSWVL